MKYLLVRLGSLGDVIHAIPTAAALRAHDPAARVDWLVDPRYADVVRMVRGVDRVIPLDPRDDKLRLLATLSTLRRTRYDVVFDVLRTATRHGGLVTVHCENGGAIEALRRRAVAGWARDMEQRMCPLGFFPAQLAEDGVAENVPGSGHGRSVPRKDYLRATSSASFWSNSFSAGWPCQVSLPSRPMMNA